MADSSLYPPSFWTHLEQLVESSEIVIDRPKRSAHHRFPDLIYPLDYGYLNGTQAMDGDGIDLWLGSMPELDLVGLAVAVDLDKKDAEIKLLLGCTQDEIGSMGVAVTYPIYGGQNGGFLHKRHHIWRV